MFLWHFALSFLANATVCGATIALFSTLGIGDKSYDLLEKRWWFCVPLTAMSGFLFLLLYVLDFYCPPHSHEVLALWPGDRIVGRTILGIALLLFLGSAYFITKFFASLPVLLSILYVPMAVFGVHLVYDPFKPEELKQRRTLIVNGDDFDAKVRLLRRITGEETNVIMFYKACTATLFLGFLANLAVWILGAVVHGTSINVMTFGLDKDARDRKYVQWLTPLILAIANFVFGLFSLLRLAVQKMYGRTDRYKNKIIADLLSASMVEDLTEHKMDVLKTSRASAVTAIETGASLDSKRQQYLHQHEQMATQLSTVIKGILCGFLVMLGLCYCARQLLSASTHLASMVAGTVAFFFVGFCVFAYASLWRVANLMGKWLVELPAWKTLLGLATNDWIRATFLCVLLPLIPIVVVMSVVNQFVRKSRGIHNIKSTSMGSVDSCTSTAAQEGGPLPGSLLLTPRVSKRIDQLMSWDWLNILPKIYVLCLGYCVTWIASPVLNVGLAWMSKVIDKAGISYPAVLLAIFVTGMVLFILPTPGAAIYIFGGVVSADQCPPKKTDQGLWLGACASILLGLCMKLFGCTIQQALIGGVMGKSLTIRQMAGVHKSGIRCMEILLRQKGLSPGKVAILVGGPDWPISVFAGILGLSLPEMLLGTLPIIFMIIPMGLTGSMYTQAYKGGLWTNLPQLLLVTSVLINVSLWAIAGWAMQQVLETHRDEISKPLAQHVDLEWLDYRADCVKKKLMLKFENVPKPLRVLWILGAFASSVVCYALTGGGSRLIGTFQVNDDVDTLIWFGWNAKECLLTYPCLGLLGVLGVALFFGQIAVSVWQAIAQGPKRKAATIEVNALEASWKDEYLKRCKSGAPLLKEAESPATQEDLSFAPADAPSKQMKDSDAGTPWAISDEDDHFLNGYRCSV